MAIEPPEMQLENEGIKALMFREKNLKPNHSEIIVELLGKAIEQFQMFKSPRSESHLTVQMAEELKSAQKCAEALVLLRPVIASYRKDKWTLLLKAVLALALKCAFLMSSPRDYVEFALELAQLSTPEECKRIAGNLTRVIGRQIPSAEPGLTSKTERAAVGLAAQKWGQPSADVVDVEMNPQMTESSLLKVQIVCDTASFTADQEVALSLFVKNKCSEEFEFPVTGIQLYTSNSQLRVESNESWSIKPSETVKKAFRFQPRKEDVKQRVVIEKVVLKLGQNVRVHFNLLTTDVAGQAKAFFPLKLSSGDETDTGSVDLDNMCPTLSAVDIEQRQPRLKMTLETACPALVGEWFVIKIVLENGEDGDLKDVVVCAQLADASDPIIADTTKLTSDYALPEPATPVTPSAEAFSFASPPVTKTVSQLVRGAGDAVKFYLKSSTTGERGVNVTVTYDVGEYTCSLEETLMFDTIEPFDVSRECLTQHHQPLTSGNAFTDEPFLLFPQLKSLSCHELTVVDSWLEPRHPLQLVQPVTSQLKDCRVPKDSLCQECFPLIIRQKDMAPSDLDVQELSVGKYVVKWTREGEFCATSSFDMATVKVSHGALYATADLPSYGVVRTPLKLCYRLTNRTDKVQEFAVLMQPSDAFMFSGNKQQHVKILPRETHAMEYILYPLLAGESIALPHLKLTSLRLAQLTDDLGVTLNRLLPAHITVLPKNRQKADKKAEKSNKVFRVEEPTVVISQPFLQKTSVKG